MAATAPSPPRILGRYALYDPIASGGMATVHFGRLLGPVGFARTVAIKRLHPQFARDPEFVSMFLDEARLAARIRHPNVVPTLDVVALEGELFLVMEYVQGEPLGGLLRASVHGRQRVPVRYAVSIVAGALRGLHAAHEAKDERGNPLGIVHRDISPQNILVGVDGVARVLDFGVAKAAGRLQTTRDGQIKGKMAYMPPEQIRSSGTDRRTDIYAAGAVLWEALTGQRLFFGDSDVAVFAKVLEGKVRRPSEVTADVPPELDDIVLQALAMAPENRFATARDMARALDAVVPLVSHAEIGEWVETIGAEHLANRTRMVTRIEVDSSASSYRPDPPPSSSPPVSVQQPVSVPQPVMADDDGDITIERTEVSGSSVVHSAVIPRFDRKRLLAAAGGFGVVFFGILLYVAVRSSSSPTTTVETTEPTASASAVAPSGSAVPPASTAAPTPASTAAAPPDPPAPPSTAAATAPSPPSQPAPPFRRVSPPPVVPRITAPPVPPPVTATEAPSARPRPHPPSPPPKSLDTVLDSRK